MIGKFLSALLAAIAMAAVTASIDGWTTEEILGTIITGAGAVITYVTTNGPSGVWWNYAKLLSYGIVSGLGWVVVALPDGWTQSDLWTLIIVVGGAVGVWKADAPVASGVVRRPVVA